jgi:hypothetical protein
VKGDEEYFGIFFLMKCSELIYYLIDIVPKPLRLLLHLIMAIREKKKPFLKI